VQPAAGAVGVEPVRVAHQDLERPLVGVLGVVGAQAVAARRAQQRVGVRGDQVEDEVLRLVRRAPRCVLVELRLGIGRGVQLGDVRGCEGRVVRLDGGVFHDSFVRKRGVP
jgi:hypothetical protein